MMCYFLILMNYANWIVQNLGSLDVFPIHSFVFLVKCAFVEFLGTKHCIRLLKSIRVSIRNQPHFIYLLEGLQMRPIMLLEKSRVLLERIISIILLEFVIHHLKQ